MAETELDFDSSRRQSYSLGMSVGLHAMILFLMLFNFNWATDDFDKNPPVILMVDLSKVELADKTNLPPEVKIKKPEPPKPQVQQKKETPKVETPKPATKTPAVRQEPTPPKQEQIKPKEAPAPKDAVKVQEPPKTKQTPKKAEKKPVKKEPVKPAPKKTTSQPKATPKKAVSKQQQSSGLQSLLASVEKVKKPANPAPAREETSAPATGQEINNGIKGGTGGSRLEALTISEKDLIANKIRDCWNVNAGVEGAETMTIELKAYVNRDGRVKDVRVLNMKGDPVFRSMADSAVRAVWVCDSKNDDSPFKILSVKHPENYSSWKEIYLRMNPIEGVF